MSNHIKCQRLTYEMIVMCEFVSHKYLTNIKLLFYFINNDTERSANYHQVGSLY